MQSQRNPPGTLYALLLFRDRRRDPDAPRHETSLTQFVGNVAQLCETVPKIIPIGIDLAELNDQHIPFLTAMRGVLDQITREKTRSNLALLVDDARLATDLVWKPAGITTPSVLARVLAAIPHNVCRTLVFVTGQETYAWLPSLEIPSPTICVIWTQRALRRRWDAFSLGIKSQSHQAWREGCTQMDCDAQQQELSEALKSPFEISFQSRDPCSEPENRSARIPCIAEMSQGFWTQETSSQFSVPDAFFFTQPLQSQDHSLALPSISESSQRESSQQVQFGSRFSCDPSCWNFSCDPSCQFSCDPSCRNQSSFLQCQSTSPQDSQFPRDSQERVSKEPSQFSKDPSQLQASKSDLEALSICFDAFESEHWRVASLLTLEEIRREGNGKRQWDFFSQSLMRWTRHLRARGGLVLVVGPGQGIWFF